MMQGREQKSGYLLSEIRRKTGGAERHDYRRDKKSEKDVPDGEHQCICPAGRGSVHREGTFAAIVGASGSGKSTLLNLLGALDTPTEGEVRIRGCSLAELNQEERTIFRRRNIGFVFQKL